MHIDKLREETNQIYQRQEEDVLQYNLIFHIEGKKRKNDPESHDAFGYWPALRYRNKKNL